MSIAMKKFRSLLENEIRKNTKLSIKQQQILTDTCLEIYVKLSSTENSRISSDIREDIKYRAGDFLRLK